MDNLISIIGTIITLLGLFLPLLQYAEVRRAIYKVLLCLYPKSFRIEHGDEMLATFMRLSDEMIQRYGWMGGGIAVVREIMNVSAESPQVWIDISRDWLTNWYSDAPRLIPIAHVSEDIAPKQVSSVETESEKSTGLDWSIWGRFNPFARSNDANSYQGIIDDLDDHMNEKGKRPPES